MAIEVGTITTLFGAAVVISADGTQRNLQIGDRLFADDIITTGVTGAIEIKFSDGSVMDLGRNSQAVLDGEVFSPQATAQLGTVLEEDVVALQYALLDGTDPTQAGETTAASAGLEGGEEGHSPVIVEYLSPVAEVISGFETTEPTITFTDNNVDADVPVQGEITDFSGNVTSATATSNDVLDLSDLLSDGTYQIEGLSAANDPSSLGGNKDLQLSIQTIDLSNVSTSSPEMLNNLLANDGQSVVI